MRASKRARRQYRETRRTNNQKLNSLNKVHLCANNKPSLRENADAPRNPQRIILIRYVYRSHHREEKRTTTHNFLLGIYIKFIAVRETRVLKNVLRARAPWCFDCIYARSVKIIFVFFFTGTAILCVLFVARRWCRRDMDVWRIFG